MLGREVGAGKRLANLVRSGRKQPQRAPLGSMSASHLIKNAAPFGAAFFVSKRPKADHMPFTKDVIVYMPIKAKTVAAMK